MVIVEVKTADGKVLEHRTFSIYSAALEWFEKARELYGRGISMTFGADHDVVFR